MTGPSRRGGVLLIPTHRAMKQRDEWGTGNEFSPSQAPKAELHPKELMHPIAG
jgi:hypothetical protein